MFGVPVSPSIVTVEVIVEEVLFLASKMTCWSHLRAVVGGKIVSYATRLYSRVSVLTDIQLSLQLFIIILGPGNPRELAVLYNTGQNSEEGDVHNTHMHTCPGDPELAGPLFTHMGRNLICGEWLVLCLVGKLMTRRVQRHRERENRPSGRGEKGKLCGECSVQ